MKKELLSDILLAGFKFPHHSYSSGYHHLANHIDCEYVDAGTLPFGNVKFESNLKQINLLLFELLLAVKARKIKVIHYLYPEQHLIFSVPKNENVVSVATIHLDEQWLDEKNRTKKKLIRTRRKTYSKLDGIICLSSDQANRLKNIYPNKNIRFIPHGVNDLGFYGEVEFSNDNFFITVVGSNYRDKDTFFEIVKYAQSYYPTWRFNLIGVSKDWKEYARNFNNTIIHPFLSEQEYFKVLQSSHVHLLPINFATANNALLEAHALGVPTLASNKTGIRDYSLDSTFLFSDVKEAILILKKISEMPINQYKRLREITKKESIKFNWPTIASEVVKFYEDIKK